MQVAVENNSPAPSCFPYCVPHLLLLPAPLLLELCKIYTGRDFPPAPCRSTVFLGKQNKFCIFDRDIRILMNLIVFLIEMVNSLTIYYWEVSWTIWICSSRQNISDHSDYCNNLLLSIFIIIINPSYKHCSYFFLITLFHEAILCI